ncbi:hypothetical protein HYR65_01985 [Candidatus Azambacteria bacterium]|nr:hypothetical protein [Candidatus Azambacteria bacterium]
MQDEKQGEAGAKNTGPGAPGELPVTGDSRRFLTHTMEGDVAQAKTDPATAAKEEAVKKPFAEYIPPPPAPPATAKPNGSDVYREPVVPGMPPLERDQPFSFPKSDMKTPDEEKQQFQIYIPTKRKAFNTTTITLLAILLLLLAGGGFGYWWIFMKTPPPAPAAVIAPEPAPGPTPVMVKPTPEPQPAPEPQPEPTPVVTEPTSTSTPAEATSTPAVVVPPQPAPEAQPEPTPVVTEPTIPQAVLSLDQTVTIEIATMDKTTLLAKLQAENTKITAQKATLRYLVRISSATEKKYLSLSEIGQLIGFTVPQSLAQSFSQSEFIGYKNGSAFRYGLAAATSHKDEVKTAALAWEASALDDLAGLYIQKAYVKPATVAFSSNTYLDFTKRYLNMPQPDVSLDWALSDKYFVVATSKEMIFAILDKTQSQTAPAVAK